MVALDEFDKDGSFAVSPSELGKFLCSLPSGTVEDHFQGKRMRMLMDTGTLIRSERKARRGGAASNSPSSSTTTSAAGRSNSSSSSAATTSGGAASNSSSSAAATTPAAGQPKSPSSLAATQVAHTNTAGTPASTAPQLEAFASRDDLLAAFVALISEQNTTDAAAAADQPDGFTTEQWIPILTHENNRDVLGTS